MSFYPRPALHTPIRNESDLPLFKPKPPDVCENFHEQTATSVEAFEKKVAPRLSATQRRVMDHVGSQGFYGCTIDEGCGALNMPWQTCGARFSELVRDDLLIRLETRRDTRRGNASYVHVTPGVWKAMGYPPRVKRRGTRRTGEAA